MLNPQQVQAAARQHIHRLGQLHASGYFDRHASAGRQKDDARREAREFLAWVESHLGELVTLPAPEFRKLWQLFLDAADVYYTREEKRRVYEKARRIKQLAAAAAELHGTLLAGARDDGPVAPASPRGRRGPGIREWIDDFVVFLMFLGVVLVVALAVSLGRSILSDRASEPSLRFESVTSAQSPTESSATIDIDADSIAERLVTSRLAGWSASFGFGVKDCRVEVSRLDVDLDGGATPEVVLAVDYTNADWWTEVGQFEHGNSALCGGSLLWIGKGNGAAEGVFRVGGINEYHVLPGSTQGHQLAFEWWQPHTDENYAVIYYRDGRYWCCAATYYAPAYTADLTVGTPDEVGEPVASISGPNAQACFDALKRACDQGEPVSASEIAALFGL